MRIRTQRLPTGYRELEYIEFTGTQQVNTYTSFNMDTGRIEIEYQSSDLNQNGMIIASSGGSNYYYFWLYYYYSGSEYTRLYIDGEEGGQFHLGGPKNDLNKHIAKYKNKTYYVDDTTYGTATVACGSTGGNLYIGSYQGGYYFKGRIYSCKISNNSSGGWMRNFVPCERISDGKPGFYNTISDDFYVNAGTGEFIKGPYKDGYKIGLYPRLPSVYQEVEYITFSGTSGAGQFIRTGINTLTHPYSVKTIYNKTNTEVRDQTLVGQRQIGKYVNIYNTYYETVFANTTSGTAPNNEKTTIEIKSGTGVLKNEEVIYSTTNTSEHTTQYELLIGAFSEDSYENAKWFFNGNIYDIQIVNNGKLYRHYIPCYRKSDNVIGMYDIVTQTFYTNSGTGNFTKGSNVNNLCACRPVDVIEEGTTNLLANPADLSKWDNPDGSATLLTNGYYDVSYSGNASWWGSRQSFHLTAGDTYTLSGYGYGPVAQLWFYKDGTNSHSSNTNSTMTPTKLTNTWTIPVTGDYWIICRCNKNGHNYYRNIQLEKKDHATPFVDGTRPNNYII